MQVVKHDDLPWYETAPTRTGVFADPSKISEKTHGFKCLLHGETGEVGNFMLVATTGATGTGLHPRHRHSFDQIRYALKGDLAMFADPKVVPEGCLAYYPAGTYYGPYSGVYDGEFIAAQFEGAHRSNYIELGGPEMKAGVVALKEKGSFKDGVYTWYDEHGKKHNKDGHVAVEEFVRGEPEVMPPPRYDAPVMMNPKNFSWIDAGKGAYFKELGTFTEKKTSVGMIKLAPSGSFSLQSPDRTTLFTVVQGNIALGNQTLTVKDALRLNAGEEQAIQSSTGAELLVLGLPILQ